MKITVMGCGASLGTPLASGSWGNCDPHESRNARTRASILVETETTKLLVDASHDCRQQLLRHKVNRLDAALISHAHSDHINGMDDLRSFTFDTGESFNFYTNQETLTELQRRSFYQFKGNDVHKAFLKGHVIDDYSDFNIGDINIQSFAQDHKTCTSLGFRFGSFAYSVDMVNLDEKALSAMEGIETWLVDCSSYARTEEEVSTHANLGRVKRWVERLKPKMTYLTVLTPYLDYQTLCNELPAHIRPAYDGLVIDL